MRGWYIIFHGSRYKVVCKSVDIYIKSFVKVCVFTKSPL